MTELEMRALMLLAGFDVIKSERRPNGYWPDCPDYDELRRQSPWWSVVTPHGQIILGDRKRVCEIGWALRQKITAEEVSTDDVTKYRHSIHAWSRVDALRHLTRLRELCERPEVTPCSR